MIAGIILKQKPTLRSGLLCLLLPLLSINRPNNLRGECILLCKKKKRKNGHAMLKTRLTVLAAVIGVLSSIAIMAQVGSKPVGTVSVSSDKPIRNAPYSAKRHFISVTKHADGTISRIESGGGEARDSQGRTYSAGERQWTYFDGNKNVLKSEILYRIDDPVANTETRWDTTSKVVSVIQWVQSASGEDTSTAKCPAACDETGANTSGDVVEKLGMKAIGGFVADGIRSSYTVPAGQDLHDQPIVVVHESWYCPELKIMILETNDDPRSGATRNELIDIVRGEPDATLYRPPTDYVIRKLRLQ